MLEWHVYERLVLAVLFVSLVAFLLLMNIVGDHWLRLATGMLILAMTGVTAVAMRRMTGY